MKETFHVTFNKAKEVIRHNGTKADDVNFNENISFADDKLYVHKNPNYKNQRYNSFTPYVPAIDPLSINNINLAPKPTTKPNNITLTTKLHNFPIIEDRPITNQPNDYEPAEVQNDEIILDNDVIPDAIPPLLLTKNNLVA
ncbi:hypothetical protein Tco_1129309 [Tanacetum coccineum]